MSGHDFVMPDLIRVEREPGGNVTVLIDGQPLPYAISGADPISCDVGENFPSIRLTLIARAVEISDRVGTPDL